ncbi:MAG: amidohydrolase, partial [Cyclobacteriaceae bacterium]|nr:amidohydrolase [Cyclobacteriaceae bacterium]
MKKIYFTLLLALSCSFVFAQNIKLQAKLDQKASEIEARVIEWRRHFHQYPELSNREFKTGKMIADHLKSLGMEVRYPVAKTGAVGILRTGKPGPTIALRADIDGLPVVERNSLPFASKEKSTYLGQEVGVMHACGHDTHIAI